MTRRLQIGDHVRIVSESGDDVELESSVRLRPGQSVDIVVERQAASSGGSRAASVVSWSVTRLGKDGPVYRGLCRWQ